MSTESECYSDIDRVVDFLKKRGFKSSIRLAIMMYLLIKNKVLFMDLVEALDITPGNLWSHLEKLQKDGLVKINYTVSDRPRVVVSITEKGFRETIDLVRNMINLLNNIISAEK